MYGTAVDFRTYHEDRGRTIPVSWDDAYLNTVLLIASEWIDNRYVNTFSGYPTDGFEQVRQWPRQSAVTNTFPQHVFTTTEIPDRVVDATYEAGFREATVAGSLDVDFTPNKYNSVEVDGAISVEYSQNLTMSDVQVQIRVVDSLIEPLIDPSKRGSSSKLSGDLNRI